MPSFILVYCFCRGVLVMAASAEAIEFVRQRAAVQFAVAGRVAVQNRQSEPVWLQGQAG